MFNPIASKDWVRQNLAHNGFLIELGNLIVFLVFWIANAYLVVSSIFWIYNKVKKK